MACKYSNDFFKKQKKLKEICKNMLVHVHNTNIAESER